MLAYWYRGQFAPCEEFDLAGTPCEEVILTGRPLFVPRGAGERWPQERQWGTEAYLGLPCIDTEGHGDRSHRLQGRAGISHASCRTRRS